MEDRYKDAIKELQQEKINQLMNDGKSHIISEDMQDEKIEGIKKLLNESSANLNEVNSNIKNIEKYKIIKTYLALKASVPTLENDRQNFASELQKAKEEKCQGDHLYFMLREDSNIGYQETSYSYAMQCLFCDKLESVDYTRRSPSALRFGLSEEMNQYFENCWLLPILARDARLLKKEGLSNKDIMIILKRSEKEIKEEMNALKKEKHTITLKK